MRVHHYFSIIAIVIVFVLLGAPVSAEILYEDQLSDYEYIPQEVERRAGGELAILAYRPDDEGEEFCSMGPAEGCRYIRVFRSDEARWSEWLELPVASISGTESISVVNMQVVTRDTYWVAAWSAVHTDANGVVVGRRHMIYTVNRNGALVDSLELTTDSADVLEVGPTNRRGSNSFRLIWSKDNGVLYARKRNPKKEKWTTSRINLANHVNPEKWEKIDFKRGSHIATVRDGKLYYLRVKLHGGVAKVLDELMIGPATDVIDFRTGRNRNLFLLYEKEKKGEVRRVTITPQRLIGANSLVFDENGSDFSQGVTVKFNHDTGQYVFTWVNDGLSGGKDRLWYNYWTKKKGWKGQALIGTDANNIEVESIRMYPNRKIDILFTENSSVGVKRYSALKERWIGKYNVDNNWKYVREQWYPEDGVVGVSGKKFYEVFRYEARVVDPYEDDELRHDEGVWRWDSKRPSDDVRKYELPRNYEIFSYGRCGEYHCIVATQEREGGANIRVIIGKQTDLFLQR